MSFSGPSLHADVWTGTVSRLADSEPIEIYPVTGWWRERPAQERYDRDARYALIVTISTKRADLELYLAVQSTIKVQSQVEAQAVEITID